MNIEFYQKPLNSTFQAFVLQVESIANIVLKFAVKAKVNFAHVTRSCHSPIEFTPLQTTLLKVLLILLIVTSILIVYSWRTYGKVITEKFVKPSTLKEIEELKLSVSKLKLPKEHSPRI